MRFIPCPTPTYTRAGTPIHNNPVNLERVVSFSRGFNISEVSSDRKMKHCISFWDGSDRPIQWIFDTEEEREASFQYVMDTVFPDLKRLTRLA